MIFFAGAINGRLVKIVITERTEAFIDDYDPEHNEPEQAESEDEE